MSDARNATMPGNGQDPGVDVLVHRVADYFDAQNALNAGVSKAIEHIIGELQKLTVDNAALQLQVKELEQRVGIE